METEETAKTNSEWILSLGFYIKIQNMLGIV